jgi:hypothetical protein
MYLVILCSLTHLQYGNNKGKIYVKNFRKKSCRIHTSAEKCKNLYVVNFLKGINCFRQISQDRDEMLYGSREPFAGGGQGEYVPVRFSNRLVCTGTSVAGLASGAFLTPRFVILDKLFPKSQIPNHISESLVKSFGAKNT